MRIVLLFFSIDGGERVFGCGLLFFKIDGTDSNIDRMLDEPVAVEPTVGIAASFVGVDGILRSSEVRLVVGLSCRFLGMILPSLDLNGADLARRGVPFLVSTDGDCDGLALSKLMIISTLFPAQYDSLSAVS